MDSDTQDDKMVLMDENRVERSIKRIAHQVVEDVLQKHTLKVVGIRERGYLMAQRLTEALSDIIDQNVSCFSLAVKEGNHEMASIFDPGKVDPEHDFILLVDDVIFSGRTMFKALQTLTNEHLPDHLHCAVLIDRGHRQLPVEAKYVGMSIPTKLNEHVLVRVAGDGSLQDVALFFDKH